MRLLIAILSGCVALSATGAGAQSATPKATEGKGARIVIEPASFDFGQALQNKTLTKDFVVRNLGNEPLQLEKPTTSCGCTAALPNESVVAPGGQTRLRVELQTRTSEGRLEKTVYVRSNDPARRVIEVKLIVTVAKSAGAK
jgi:hypothetical protein